MNEVPEFHMLKGEIVTSIVSLSKNEYLCSLISGSLHLINTITNTRHVYANKYGGDTVQCMIPFPGFCSQTMPLVLIKEAKYVVIFNTKSKKYLKIVDIDTKDEDINHCY